MDLTLPVQIVGKPDIVRLQREIEQLLNDLLANEISSKEIGQGRVIPGMSQSLSLVLSVNSMTANKAGLEELQENLELLTDQAPSIRIAFAREPIGPAKEKVITWLRSNLGSNLLIQIGIQPAIAGGVVVQTKKSRFDLSLRKRIIDNADKIGKSLRDVK